MNQFLPRISNWIPFDPSAKLVDRVSLGEDILVPTDISADKRAGVEAYKKADFPTAIRHFEAALRQHRNDPETAIYLNNAKIKADQNSSTLRIAVSVPIGGNLNVAQEILRGVAQAQDEVNSRGGINGKGLEVEIANDDNNAEVGKQIANHFVKENRILAVIGHNASNVSLAAAPIYQQGSIVMISPTSSSSNLSGFGSYIFRTVLNHKTMATHLAEYSVNTAQKKTIAICYDSQAADSSSFKDEFSAAVTRLGGRIASTVCDFASPTFNASTAIAEAQSSGADAILMAPFIERLSQGVAILRANQGKLTLMSSPTSYTFQILDEGKTDADGLVLPAPWHPQMNPKSLFPEVARQRWGGVVSWRTASSYDATVAIATALQRNPTRSGVQQTLRDPNFAATGAAQSIQFLATGDRAGTPILVQVQRSGTAGRVFALLN